MISLEKPLVIERSGNQILWFKELGGKYHLCVEDLKLGWIDYPLFTGVNCDWVADHPGLFNKSIADSLSNISSQLASGMSLEDIVGAGSDSATDQPNVDTSPLP